MADYQDIRGLRVKYLSADPGDPVAGEVWYNSTTGTLKSVVQSAAWSSSSPVLTAREWLFMAGTQTAALGAGGGTTPPGATYKTNVTEEYDGTGWASGGNLVTGRYRGGSGGTQTAALAVAGYIQPPGATGVSAATEEYNGTAWTEVNTISEASRSGMFLGAVGIQSNSLLVGGEGPAVPGVSNLVEEYDGTNWTAGGTYPTATYAGAVTGATGTTAITAGGQGPGTVNTSKTYNGTSWSDNPTINTARDYMSGFGTSTACLITGGVLPPGPNTFYDKVEEYDGTSWSEIAELASVRSRMGSGGSTTAGVVFAGNTPALTATTEEYNVATTVVTPATWASGGTMPANYYGFSGRGVGTATAGLAMAGATSPPVVNQVTLLKYDGTSWTANPSNMATARRSGASLGTQTAALYAGGYVGGTPDGPFQNATEEFDGSTASSSPVMPYSGSSNWGFGTQTAAVVAGGYAPPFPSFVTTAGEYNGASWTAATALPTAYGLGGSAGQTQTAGLIWAGLAAPGSSTSTLEYNGASWTAGNAYLEAKSNLAGFGSQTAAISAGGEPSTTTTAEYDGTTWSTRVSLPSMRAQSGSAGSGATDGMIFGGETPSVVDTTLEYSGETSAANIETLTTS